MAELAIPLAARAAAVGATAADGGASLPRRVLLLAQAAAAGAIVAGSLAVETGLLDRPIPFQTSAALAAAVSDRHPLQAREPEGALPLVFLVRPTAVEVEAQALPIMEEGPAAALVQAGAAPPVLVRWILRRRELA